MRSSPGASRLSYKAPAPYESGSESLSSIAYELGYCDQAHFINDFRRLAGVPPGSLTSVATRTVSLNAVYVSDGLAERRR
jgi:AraC-like DNA-binding protein